MTATITTRTRALVGATTVSTGPTGLSSTTPTISLPLVRSLPTTTAPVRYTVTARRDVSFPGAKRLAVEVETRTYPISTNEIPKATVVGDKLTNPSACKMPSEIAFVLADDYNRYSIEHRDTEDSVAFREIAKRRHETSAAVEAAVELEASWETC